MPRSYLAEACLWLGIVMAHRGEARASGDLMREAEELTRDLSEKNPKDPTLRGDLADIGRSQMEILAARGERDKAEALGRGALEHAMAAAQAQPNDVGRQVSLALCHEGLANLAALAGRTDAAREGHGKALSIWDQLTTVEPACVTWHAARAVTLARVGRGKEAEQVVNTVTAKARESGSCELWLQMARYHAARATASPGSEDRRLSSEQAVAALEAALEAGYRDVFVIESDPDLAVIRQLPAFKALVKKISASRLSRSLAQQAGG